MQQVVPHVTVPGGPEAPGLLIKHSLVGIWNLFCSVPPDPPVSRIELAYLASRVLQISYPWH